MPSSYRLLWPTQILAYFEFKQSKNRIAESKPKVTYESVPNRSEIAIACDFTHDLGYRRPARQDRHALRRARSR